MALAMTDPSPPPEPTVPEPESSEAQTVPADGSSGFEPEQAAPGTSRRWFLAGGVAVLLGAGAGAAVELSGRSSPAAPAAAPAALVAAVRAERALIADLDATTGGSGTVRSVIRQARADHAAHLAALRGVLAGYVHPRASAMPPGRARARAQLRAAETAAAQAAAQHATDLTGAAAALLASIAACEATHAELLR